MPRGEEKAYNCLSEVERPDEVSEDETEQGGEAESLIQRVAKASMSTHVLTVVVVKEEQQRREHDAVQHRESQDDLRCQDPPRRTRATSERNQSGGNRD